MEKPNTGFVDPLIADTSIMEKFGWTWTELNETPEEVLGAARARLWAENEFNRREQERSMRAMKTRKTSR